jgi:hypothetical protein
MSRFVERLKYNIAINTNNSLHIYRRVSILFTFFTAKEILHVPMQQTVLCCCAAQQMNAAGVEKTLHVKAKSQHLRRHIYVDQSVCICVDSQLVNIMIRTSVVQ